MGWHATLLIHVCDVCQQEWLLLLLSNVYMGVFG